ncbi:MAG: ABC transporter substrate-binding protein [Acidimicrobiaceae bacterium]|nr:ABC transporter substrate-binding protein [Acidimicrobiaceae bacterium]
MAKIPLSAVSRTQGNNEAVKNGTVTPKGFEFDFTEVPILVQAFRRMVRGLEFDVCEMAITTYICAKSYGKAFTALPVFLVRGFHHEAILYNTKSAVRTPKDLEGGRVGVNRGYTVTTGVWARGIMQDEYGVDLSKVTWVLSGDEHVAEYKAPSNVISMEPGNTLEDMLIAGDLDAVIGVEVTHPDIAPLIPNPTETAFEALRERGLYPVNHLIVIKDELLEKYPDLAADVFDTFARSKKLYVEKLRTGELEKPNATDLMYLRVMNVTGSDPLPYGINTNRATIEKLLDHAMTQSIINQRPAVESLFAPSTRDLDA